MLENVSSSGHPAQDYGFDVSGVQSSDIVSIFGARIANLAYARGFEMVERLLAHRAALFAAGAANARAGTLYFCNANTLGFAKRDAAYAAALNRADILYGDGTGVRLAAAMRGVGMKANLNGTDLVPQLLRSRAGRGERCFILGGEDEANRTAAEYFRQTFPGVTLAGRHHGFLSDADSPEIVRMINEARPDILLVGMGHPRQELWIDAHAAALKVPLIIAVGGLFAYWGNGLKRASNLSRRFGFEWFEIMLQQPHKMQRYLLGGPVFLAEAARAAPADLQRMRGSAA